MDLTTLGYDEFFRVPFEQLKADDDALIPARISQVQKYRYKLMTPAGEVFAVLPKKFRYQAEQREQLPVVGDFVAAVMEGDEGVITHLLPRKNKLSRKTTMELTEEQVIAANIDTVFLVSGLDGEFNLRRIERFLTVVREAESEPVVVLNKSDLVDLPETYVEKVVQAIGDIPVHCASGMTGIGIDEIASYLSHGHTAVFIGASGVGKSTLINSLLGTDRQKTQDVREADSKGRHTTTFREMIPMPGGGVVIDSPGMREVQIWADEDVLGQSFDDVETLAESCRFRDCRHEGEPGCAVAQAISAGELDQGRLVSYLRQKQELEMLAERKSRSHLVERKSKMKQLHKEIRRYYKYDKRR